MAIDTTAPAVTLTDDALAPTKVLPLLLSAEAAALGLALGFGLGFAFGFGVVA